MLFEIFQFELKYRAKRPDTYLYFALLTLCSSFAVDFIFEGALGPVKENAPYIIGICMSILSAFFMMITSMIMGVAVLRDTTYKMGALLWTKPIKKWEYLLGRFGGAFTVLVLIFSGVLWGSMLSIWMPWREPTDLLSFDFWSYLKPFLLVVLPTLFFGSALFFVSGALSRKLIVVYTQGILFFMLYLVSMVLSQDVEDPFWAALLDPFSFQTIKAVARHWTPLIRNENPLPVGGLLLYNRLIWIGLGILILMAGYFGFDTNLIKNAGTKQKAKPFTPSAGSTILEQMRMKIPTFPIIWNGKTRLYQFLHLSYFYFKTLLKEPSFWAIVICGMAIIFVNSISLGTTYGVESYPLTYVIVEELEELSIGFFLIIMVFFSGEMIWKEKDIKLHFITDATPIATFIQLASKFTGLVLIYIVLMLALILSGLLFQTTQAYYDYQLAVYLIDFFLVVLPFLALFTIASFVFQTLVHHKFVAHLLLVFFVFGTLMLKVLGYSHGLYSFGGNDLGIYSAMNQYGHFAKPYAWFKVYWMAFALLLLIISSLFVVRGSETALKVRWRLGKSRLTRPLLRVGFAGMLVFGLTGCYIFYNTNVLNTYTSASEEAAYRISYEKNLKAFEYLPQPKIVDINLSLELYPSERNYTVEGYYILVNTDSFAIDEIHVQSIPNEQIVLEELSFEGGAETQEDYVEYGYIIHQLTTALQAGDSIKMSFRQSFTTRGFTEGQNIALVYNGSFLNNDHFPSLGYNRNLELQDDASREDYGLTPRVNRAKRDDPRELYNGRSGEDGYEIHFEMTVGTDPDQIAIAPGTLLKEWKADQRNYFHYKMEAPMINFYAIVSARYEVVKDKWLPAHDSLGHPIDLEIYYHKEHDYNLDRMMASMQASFDYYSKHFSPYPYQQLRIMEFPRYKNFAQSFPGTIPFSEAIGFILDIDDDVDVDMAAFVTAHELAHQWWGLEVVAANVEGRHMILEALSQYSALMVMQQMYGEEKVQQFLRKERKSYLEGRTGERGTEMPLAQVQSQKYTYYHKGALNLYAFQDYISEDSLNLALQRFIRDWNCFEETRPTERYATTLDLLDYFREVTPDSLQYVIADLFETVTLYENKCLEGSFEKQAAGRYQVELTVEAAKYRVDSLGVENPIAIDDWMDIGVYGVTTDGRDTLLYLQPHKIVDHITAITILLDQAPTRAGIDPLLKLIDKEGDDNMQTVKGLSADL